MISQEKIHISQGWLFWGVRFAEVGYEALYWMNGAMQVKSMKFAYSKGQTD